ncbi:MAG: PilZ domain-containing protein [Treponema sp.]|nr:PilZ domain-containing protein [Treponema sp.]
MYILIGCLIAIGIIFLLALFYNIFRDQITFFITGLDAKFSLNDLFLLWKVGKLCDLDSPTNLFWSMNSLTKCMYYITTQASEDKKENDPDTQKLISRLFDYRTKLQNQSDEKKGLDTTLSLEKGQKLRIILPGKGVFYSKILNNGKEIVINVPRQKNLIPVPAEAWDGKVVSIYLWRKGDARYVFDTQVLSHGMFLGEASIALRHSNNLIRTQKRKAVRAKCDINAQLYIIKSQDVDYSAVETKGGYKCHIEDISESGALIRIGGKGVENIQIKLQFSINNMLVIMAGIIRRVEFNELDNQSLLHFECVQIEPFMRNAVLSYVYNLLPEKDKEVYEALSQTDDDEKALSDDEKAAAIEKAVENIIESDNSSSKDSQNSENRELSNDSEEKEKKETENIGQKEKELDFTNPVQEYELNS